jgi:hypothetical protein
MKDTKRYTVGFTDKGISSGITSLYPELIPVIDHESVFAFGIVSALCNTKEDATILVNKLNKLEQLEKLIKS